MRITRITLITATLLIAACNGPSPALIGTKGQDITVDGGDFRVFVKGDRVEAVRLNFEFPTNVRRVFPRARIAMEQVSGCTVAPDTMTGDAAHIRAKLDCDG